MVELFQDVQSPEAFFKFFDSRFKLIENNLNRKCKTYQASIDEKLFVQVDESKDLQRVNNSHYRIILFSNGKKYNSIKFFGSFYNGTDEKVKRQKRGRKKRDKIEYDVEYKNYLEYESLRNRELISRMNDLKYVKQSVNPFLLLFGLSDEQRYIKGELKNWIRTSENKIIAREKLKDILLRLKDWREEHPVSNERFKEYDSEQCKKAKCIHFMHNKCEFLQFPNNDKKAYKLKNGSIGYCLDYYIIDIGLLIKDLQDPVDNFFANFERAYSLLITEFKSIKYEIFNKNIASKSFDSSKFGLLINSIIELKNFNREKELRNFEGEYKELKSLYIRCASLIKGYSINYNLNRAYKKIHKKMNQDIRALHNLSKNLTRRFSDRIKTLKLYNRLSKELFTGRNSISLTFDSLKKDMVIYFEYSRIEESHSLKGSKLYTYTNVGRIFSNSRWIDYYLAPDYYCLNRKKNPIYKVITVNKKNVYLEDIDTKQEVKLLPNRIYAPQILFLLGNELE